MVRGQSAPRHRGGNVWIVDDIFSGPVPSAPMKADLYTRFFLWLAAYRRSVLLLTFLVVGASIIISSRIDLEEDILATLPQRDQIVDEYRYVLRKFRQIDRVYIDVGINADDPD